MDREIEKEIIKQYVRKNKQERIIWELGSARKRNEAIWRFNTPEIFMEECLHPINYMGKEEMRNYLFKLSNALNVYYIGTNKIGCLSLKKAVELASQGDICIIYCGNGIGYYQGEQEFVAPPRFMLLSKNRKRGGKNLV